MPGGVADLLALQIIISLRDTASAMLARFGITAGGALAPVQMAALGVAAGVAAIAAASVHAATGFDQSMQRIAALTATSAAQMADYKNQLLAMAPALDQTPQALADGLYFVISSGHQGADALNILSLSAKAAAATMTPLKDVSDLLTTAINAYRGSGLSAAHAMDDIINTVTQGKVMMSSLATSFGFVGVTAHAAGLSFDEASAAVSTLSQVAGQHGSRRIMMDLDNLLRSVGINVDGVAKRAKSMGIAFDEGKFASSSFIEKLQMLAQVTGGVGYNLNWAAIKADLASGNMEDLALQTAHANAKFMSLVGGAAAFLPAAMLLSDKGAEYNVILGTMGEKASQAGQLTNNAFIKMRESTAQMQRMAEIMFQTILTRIGLQLLPALNQFLSGIYKVGEGLYTWVSSARGWEKIKTFVLGLAIVIATLLGPAIVSAAAGLAMFLAPVAAVIAASILLGTAVRALVAHFGGWDAILRRVHPLLVTVQQALSAAWAEIRKAFADPAIQSALRQLQQALPELIPVLKILGVEAAAVVVVAFNLVKFAILAVARVLPLLIDAVTLAVHVWGALANAVLGIPDTLHGAGNAFSALGSTVHGALTGALSAVAGFAQGVGAFFGFVYNHSYLVKQTTDNIHAYFLGLWHDVQTIGGWIGGAWDWIWQHASASVRAIWGGIVAYWQGQVAVARQWMDAIATALKKPIQDLGTWLFNAGKALLHMLAQGIMQNVNEVVGQATQVASAIKNVIGWHSPTKEGPGRDSHTWAPNLVRMFASGLHAGVPAVSAAATRLASAATLGGSVAGLGGAAGGASSAFGSLAGAAAATGGGGATHYHDWAGAFPNATNAQQIEAAIRSVQRDDYRRARRAGFGGGLRAGIGGGPR